MKSLLLLFALVLPSPASAQDGPTRVVSGVVVSQQNELVPGVTVVIISASGERRVESDGEGRFRAEVSPGPVTLKFFGRGIMLVSKTIGAAPD